MDIKSADTMLASACQSAARGAEDTVEAFHILMKQETISTQCSSHLV